MLQNHSNVVCLVFCVYQCVMNIFTKFYLPTTFESSAMDPSLHILKCALQVIKHSSMTTLVFCVFAFNKKKRTC